MKKILVIDDDPEMIELLRNRLEKKKFQVISASEGVEGLVRAKEEKPALIILDIVMPVMDGYVFVQQFKRDDALNKIPVIILTAKDQLQNLFQVENMSNFVAKPFDFDALYGMIQKLTA